ncbi:C-terminal binding protein [Lentibacillus lipolyticus]|nr:C-terminal binding protein [Lentibacillus lipolyticus]
MTINKKVWILDDKGLTHDVELAVYKQNEIEWKVTATKETKGFEEDLSAFGQHADAVVTQVGFPCDEELIKQLTHCKAIFTFGMGFNNVNLEVARQHGIHVCHVPDYCLEEVADHTLALALTSMRKLHLYNRSVKKGEWNPVFMTPVHRMSNTVIGLYGFGRIARKVAERLKAFGSELIAYDEYVPESVFKDYSVKKVDFDSLLEQSNVLSLHVPLTPETRNSLDYGRLSKLPKHAIIINTCRGGIINEQDLLRLIREKHISCAGLDVLEEEPPAEGNELIYNEDVVISPHAAYFSMEAEKELQVRTAENVVRIMNKEKPLHIVNQ